MLRLARMHKLGAHMNDLVKASALRIVRLFAFIITICHWVACGWWLVATEWKDVVVRGGVGGG